MSGSNTVSYYITQDHITLPTPRPRPRPPPRPSGSNFTIGHTLKNIRDYMSHTLKSIDDYMSYNLKSIRDYMSYTLKSLFVNSKAAALHHGNLTQ